MRNIDITFEVAYIDKDDTVPKWRNSIETYLDAELNWPSEERYERHVSKQEPLCATMEELDAPAISLRTISGPNAINLLDKDFARKGDRQLAPSEGLSFPVTSLSDTWKEQLPGRSWPLTSLKRMETVSIILITYRIVSSKHSRSLHTNPLRRDVVFGSCQFFGQVAPKNKCIGEEYFAAVGQASS